MRRSVSRNLSMLDLGYPNSPSFAQHHASRLTEPPADGQPTLPIHRASRSACGSGWTSATALRLACAPSMVGCGPCPVTPCITCFRCCTAGSTCSLLFAGSAETEEAYHRLAALGAQVHARHQRSIRVAMIEASRPDDSWGRPGKAPCFRRKWQPAPGLTEPGPSASICCALTATPPSAASRPTCSKCKSTSDRIWL